MRHDPSLEFLPDWLPDETLFSLASRYHRLTGHVAGRHTSKILFGSARSGYQHDLPSGIDHFVRVTHGHYGQCRSIIRSRTLLPYYLVFKDRSVGRHALASMRGPRIGHLKYRLGILTSGARAHHPLRACDACIKEDLFRFGVGYWHLNHQFPGVLVCQQHRQILRVSTLKTSGVQRFGYFLPGDADANLDESQCSADGDTLSILQSLSDLSAQVSRIGRNGRLKIGALRMACDVVFRKKNYLSTNGRLRQERASTDFAEFISPVASLSEFEALPRDPRTISYMLSRLRSPTASTPHPIRLIAVMAWLFSSFEQYVATAKKVAATGGISNQDIVHPSSNEDAADKRQAFLERAKNGEAVSRAAVHVGVDPAVGIGWALSENIPVSRRRKSVRGELLTKVRQQLKSGQTKQYIAEELGVSVSSVSRVLYSDPALADTWKVSLQKKKRQTRRQAWSGLVSSHGHLGTKLLRELEPAVYGWLYRNDRSWLDAQRVNIATKVPRPATRVNWQQRDDDLVADLRGAIDLIARSPEKKPISIGRLCQLVPDLKRRLGQTNRLPRTRRLLNLVMNKGGQADSSDALPFT